MLTELVNGYSSIVRNLDPGVQANPRVTEAAKLGLQLQAPAKLLQIAGSLPERWWVQAAGKIHFAALAHLRKRDGLDSMHLPALLLLLPLQHLLCLDQRAFHGCLFHLDNLVL